MPNTKDEFIDVKIAFEQEKEVDLVASYVSIKENMGDTAIWDAKKWYIGYPGSLGENFTKEK